MAGRNKPQPTAATQKTTCPVCRRGIPKQNFAAHAQSHNNQDDSDKRKGIDRKY